MEWETVKGDAPPFPERLSRTGASLPLVAEAEAEVEVLAGCDGLVIGDAICCQEV